MIDIKNKKIKELENIIKDSDTVENIIKRNYYNRLLFNSFNLRNNKLKELENIIKNRYKESNNIKNIIVRYNDIVLLFNSNLLKCLIIDDELRCSWTDELTGEHHIKQYNNIEELLIVLDIILN
ncbi:hypothetical protein R4K54_04195 [Brachyspira murdochii]|uniref:hypothetical protein n=1 Tax=Brachyspira murdochii TaxID=84378 RepID=UPI003004306B